MSNTQKQSVGSIDRSNLNVYSRQCTLPNPAPEGRTDTLQKNPPIVFFIGQLLAEYTQYPYINPTDIYFPIVGSIYPIQLYAIQGPNLPRTLSIKQSVYLPIFVSGIHYNLLLSADLPAFLPHAIRGSY